MATRFVGRFGDLVGYALVALLVLFYTGVQINYAIQRGDQLSDMHGRYSEANAIRAAEGFYDHGFTYNDGLADIAYGNAVESAGSKHDSNMCASSQRCVYLHTAPGQDLLAGLATKIFGKGHIARYRTVPLTISFAGLAFMAWAMARAAGPLRAAFVVGTFYFVPMITASMHNLSFLSYEIAFFELEVGVLLLCFFRDLRPRIGLPALFVIGFLSAWASYDFLAHVCLCAPVVWLLRGELRAHRKTMLYCAAASSAGYFLGCALHLIQVAAFLGGFRAMLDDYMTRGMSRMSGSVERGVKTMTSLELVVLYTSRLVGQPNFFLGNYLWTTGLSFGALFLRRLPPVRVRGVEYRWLPAPSLKWGFLLAFVIPLIWVVIMRQHASAHVFYVPRNFLVTFIFGAFALSLAVQRRELPVATKGQATDAAAKAPSQDVAEGAA